VKKGEGGEEKALHLFRQQVIEIQGDAVDCLLVWFLKLLYFKETKLHRANSRSKFEEMRTKHLADNSKKIAK